MFQSILHYLPVVLQSLPLQPAAWGLPGCVCPGSGRASRVWRPLPAPHQSLVSPSQSPPRPPLFSLRLGTLVTETMTMVQSTWPLVTWGNAVVVIPAAPPTAVSRARFRTSPYNGVPWLHPHPDAHLSQKARGVQAGGPEDTHAHFLTQGSIRNSGMVSKLGQSTTEYHMTIAGPLSISLNICYLYWIWKGALTFNI